MPKPYKTSCVEYKAFGYNSRLKSVSKCKIKFSTEEYKVWRGIYLAKQLSDEHILSMNPLLEKMENWIWFLKKNILNSVDIMTTISWFWLKILKFFKV